MRLILPSPGSLILGILLFSGATISSVQTASAQTAANRTNPGGSITVAHSGKCIAPANNGRSNGTEIQQIACSGASDQNWRVENTGSGLYIRHLESNRCLHQHGGNNHNLGRITLWTCFNQGNVTFGAKAASAGHVLLSPEHNNLCIEPLYGQTGNNVRLVQTACKATTGGLHSQMFKLPRSSHTITLGHSGKCIAPANKGISNGTPIHQVTCTGTSDQDWEVEDMGGGFYIRHLDSNRCLHQHGGHSRNLGRITLWTCFDQGNVIFDTRDAAAEHVLLSPQHNNLCVAARDGRREENTPLVQTTCKSPDGPLHEQMFTLPRRIHPITVAHSGKCIEPQDGGHSRGTAIHQVECNGSSHQDWTIENLGQRIYVRHINSGRCLHQHGGTRADLARITLWTCYNNDNILLSSIDSEPGHTLLRLQHSNLCVEPLYGQTSNNVPLVQTSCKSTSGALHEQMFKLPRSERAISLGHNSKCIAPANGGITKGVAIHQVTCNGGSHQDWKVENIGNGQHIRHIDSNLCLHQHGGINSDLGRITLWTCLNKNNVTFDIAAAHSGHVTLSPQHNNLCVAPRHGQLGDNIPLVQTACEPATRTFNEQMFKLPRSERAITIGHSGLCIAPTNGGTSKGVAIHQVTCTGAGDQDWKIENLGNGLHIRHIRSNLCLHQHGRTSSNFGRITLWSCSKKANVVFDPTPTVSGHVMLSPQHNNLCIEPLFGQTDNDVRLVQTSCQTPTGTLTQQMFKLPEYTGLGAWSEVFRMPLVPVAAATLPDGKVLSWSAYDRYRFGGDRGRTFTSIFDPATGNSTEQLVHNTNHDMFCPGISMLGNGDILVTGGASANDASIYRPGTNTWTEGTDMIVPRGYQSSTTLGTGDVFTVGGSWSGGRGNKYGEVFSPTSNVWRPLTNVQAEPLSTQDRSGIYRADNHMWLYPASNGEVFHAGPSNDMHWINTNGAGSHTYAASRGGQANMTGTSVMFDIDRILIAGGSVDQHNSSPGRSDSWVVDISGGRGNVNVRRVADMAYARAIQSSVVLPSGEVVVLGGQAFSKFFSDDASVLVPEIFNPDTESWSQHPPMQVPRNYHSAAVLLKDGRVWAGGGGLCGSCSTNHPDAEIFTPPYLISTDGFPQVRPRITQAPGSASHGAKIRVSADDGAASFVLMRLGTATHTINTDQRRVPVNASRVSATAFDIEIPSNANVVVPGNYFLFAISENGVPSVAVTINIQ